MKKPIFILVTLRTLCVLPAYAQETGGIVSVHNGFLTGNDYLKLGKEERVFYAVGIIEGMLLSPFLGAPQNRLSWIEHCMEGMTNYQAEAIISKYLENHPGEWHQQLHVTTFDAMNEACKRFK